MRLRTAFGVALASTIVVGFIGPVDMAHAATIIVTSTGDDDPTGPDDGDCTLREGIDAANSDTAEDACAAGSGADLISLPAGTYTLGVTGGGEDAGNTGDLDILSAMTIQGAGPGTTIIEGGVERGFHTPPTATPPDVEISGVTIRGGSVPADGGGAIFNQGALLRLVRVALTGNVAEYGGGIANDDPATLTVNDSLISGNTALPDVGGGVDLDGVVSTFTNVTVSGNTADDGGGLWVSNGSATLNNVTVTGNTATSDGGGIQNDGSGPVTLRNTIVAGNSDASGGTAPDCDQTITSQGHNLIGNVTGCTFAAATGDKVGTGSAPIDPKLGLLVDNGGPTMTHALLTGSPAIDGGDPATPGSGGTSCAANDQRGIPRNCDIGAYELILCGTVPVNRIGTSGDDTLTGTDAADGFLAGDGNDTATGLGGDDVFCLQAGDDAASGGAGNDQILGDVGNDTGDGGEGNDTFLGSVGNDIGKGAAGKDLLKGEAGKDKLNGGSGKDKLIGGGGKDKLTCGAGKNEVGKGGPGKDTSAKCEKGKA